MSLNPTSATRIKICGITSVADAEAAVSLGANAIGVICVPESARLVSPETVAQIRAVLPLFTPLVVVVKTTEEAFAYGSDFIQFYEVSPSAVRKNIRVFRVKDKQSLDEIVSYPFAIDAILLDTYHEKALGGVGTKFDWDLAVEAKTRTNLPLLLAGGLTPENVAEAVRHVKPYAVDVASGVESSIGKKDYGKIKAFIEAVRGAI
jgi:phosphoribosylanthranilate isomerase